MNEWYIGKSNPWAVRTNTLTKSVQRAADRVSTLESRVASATRALQGPEAANTSPKQFRAAQDALDKHTTNLKDAQNELKAAQQKLEAQKAKQPPKPPTGGSASSSGSRAVQHTLAEAGKIGGVAALVAAGASVAKSVASGGVLGWFLAPANA